MHHNNPGYTIAKKYKTVISVLLRGTNKRTRGGHSGAVHFSVRFPYTGRFQPEGPLGHTIDWGEWSSCFAAHTVNWAVFRHPSAAGCVADQTPRGEDEAQLGGDFDNNVCEHAHMVMMAMAMAMAGSGGRPVTQDALPSKPQRA